MAPTLLPEVMPEHTLRIAWLHLAPIPGAIAYNRKLVETAVTTASELGAAWILTPELCICGYQFADRIGTEWILPQPDPWMTHFCQLAARVRVTVFLSHPERDPYTNKLYNSVFVIAADGTLMGKHRKINVLPGAELWSSPGEQAVSVRVQSVNVGILICADVCTLGIAKSLRGQGAQLLVSAAAWGPGLHEPNGEWEQCTRETGLPLLVCNRTGPDQTLNFTGAKSVVVKEGQRLLSFHSQRSAILTVDWDLQTQNLATQEHQTVYL
jgi:N-carbamoylputrescine amidase